MRLASLILPTVAIAAPSADKRPTLDEYKESKAKQQDELDAMAANQAKMAAVDKVIKLFEDLKSQVLEEGEKEAKSYEKFACFCKDTSAEKADAIQTGEDDKEALSSKIEGLGTKRDDLDKKIETLEEDIEKLEEDVKKATKERKKTNKVYEGDAADLSGAIEAVRNALRVMKESKNPSLMQLRSVTSTIQQVATLGDALGFLDAPMKSTAAVFLQDDPSVEMENYKFHGDNVIGMLEELQGKFRKMKADIDETEVKSVRDYQALVQQKTWEVKTKTEDMENARENRANTIAALASSSEKLTIVASTLLDDQEYMTELAQICQDKAKTWDQRSKVRADELSALEAAATIIRNDVAEATSSSTVRLAQKSVTVRLAQAMVRNPLAMEAVEEEAEEADKDSTSAKSKVLNFLQRVSKHSPSVQSTEEGRQAVITMLDKESKQFKSTLLASLATQIAADPFAKVKTLIQELIERLLHESAAEADQKGFCDKSQASAKGKRARAAQKVEELNGRLAENEAIRDKLVGEIDTLEDEIATLESDKKEAIDMRKEEKEENKETVEQAEAGLKAVKEAIDIMEKFYKTSAKEEVDLDLMQKGPADDVPDAGFEGGEAYKGMQSESGGVLGMLDVIKSDFDRTISETKKAEDQAEADHFDFLTETGKSLAKKNTAVDEKKKQKKNTLEELENDGDSLDDQSKILRNAIKELLDLKPACVDTGMSYEERVSRREDEIEGLKKALCIFTHYAEYGADSVGEC